MTEFEPIENWEQDIRSESSIYSVVKVSIGLIGNKAEQRLVLGLLALSLVATVVSAFWFPELVAEQKKQLQFARDVNQILIGYYATMLGFITASFSVVLGIFNKGIFVALARQRKKSRPVSEFKFMFFGFLHALFVFGTLLALSFTIWASCHENGPAKMMPNSHAINSLIMLINFWLCVGFLYSLLQIKTLIWNVFQVVIADVILHGRQEEN